LYSAVPHPNFQSNSLIYLCYHQGTYESNTVKIARATLTSNRLENLEELFDAGFETRETQHFGCPLIWDDDGYLFATFGDRLHHPEEAQDLSNIIGTSIRIADDGSIPEDNPFIGLDDVRPEIWAYGIRNAQGAAVHPVTRELWFSDHGPYGGDEVNIMRRGANFGWPIATYGIEYDGTVITNDAELPGVDGPLAYWRPSIAPSSIAFYTGRHFKAWRNDLFMATLVNMRLVRMEIREDRILSQEHLLAELNQRIRDVKMGPDGFLYIVTDGDPAAILRLEPVSDE
jgi:glucose/arabinose dehydrogenase